ncbi:uncharacterized protein LOC143152897 [Ptiloglossa arizonensis]|uniref:uncharacterized protein LOC143152897 n=1 Tax=Ptiloglossa arizonensis TaxID=3350558 RepID=UPI003F9EF1A0
MGRAAHRGSHSAQSGLCRSFERNRRASFRQEVAYTQRELRRLPYPSERTREGKKEKKRPSEKDFTLPRRCTRDVRVVTRGIHFHGTTRDDALGARSHRVRKLE